MNAPMKTQSVANAALTYPPDWRFCVIPRGTKGPTTLKWNEAASALAAAQLAEGTPGIGLLHSWSGTCSIDIDAVDQAKVWLAERGIDLDQLLNAEDAVQIVSGRPNKGKLLYALPTQMMTKKIVINGKVILEFRNSDRKGQSVQCCLPPTNHPDTGLPYVWEGRGSFKALPTLPDAIVKVWAALIEQDSTPSVMVKGEYNTSADEIALAVGYCDPDSDRTPWLQVGMALKLELGDAGFPIWDEWSKQSAKYPGQREMSYQWSTFKPVANPVTVGTIFHHAKASGWKRPPPDLSKLFKPNVPIKPLEQVIAELFPPAPPINLELLPKVLADYAGELSREVGCDPVAPVFAGLSAVSGAVNAQSKLWITDKWKEPPIMWFLTHGDAADKKTPSSKPLLDVLHDLEAEDYQRYETEVLQWAGKEARHAADMKAFRDWQQSPESHMPGATPPTVMGLPPKPVRKRIIVTDVKSQKVARMLSPRPEGLLLYRDEAASWLDQVSNPRSGEDRSMYAAAIHGGPYALDRQGDGKDGNEGSIPIPNLAISIYGNIQPDVFTRLSAAASEDGLLSRFIVGILDTNTSKVSGDPVPAWASSGRAYEQSVRAIHAMPVTSYTLSQGAYEAFKAFEGEAIALNKWLKAQGVGIFLSAAIGKAQGFAGRLMLLFHLLTDPTNTVIPASTARNAIQLYREFVIPHLFAADAGGKDEKLEKWVINRIIVESGNPTVTLSDLRRTMKRQSSYKNIPDRTVDEMLRAAMVTVERLGWVEVIRDDFKSTQWAISPKLAVVYANERERAAKERAEFVEYVRNRK